MGATRGGSAALSRLERTFTVDDRRAMKVRAAVLHVKRGRDAGLCARIDRPSFVIGTGEIADLRLTDPAVSRDHVRLSLLTEGLRVRDDSSKNGTLLAGVRIRDALVKQDTAIVVGGTTISLSIESDAIELPLSSNDRFGDALGTSPSMRHVFATLERAAPSDLTVLVEGESGVGKEVLARAIHDRSSRARGPFVVVDCGAIPANLIESELFGHERGAFTGAHESRRGVLEEANGGTIFLDEIGELPLDMQPKLLRVLEQREVRPVGGRAARPIDVRVVAATNRRLAEASRTGEFRSDLFYRLAVVRVTVPPLRERQEDILLIARAMLRDLTSDPEADFSAEIASMLQDCRWPGNVRELRNFVERYAVLGREVVQPTFDPTEGATAEDEQLASMSYQDARKLVLDRFEQKYFAIVLQRAGGVVTRAAEFAQVRRPSFYRMIERVRCAGDR
jgi:transcriptional regulator with PAS, ATPase and Fis domain